MDFQPATGPCLICTCIASTGRSEPGLLGRNACELPPVLTASSHDGIDGLVSELSHGSPPDLSLWLAPPLCILYVRRCLKQRVSCTVHELERAAGPNHVVYSMGHHRSLQRLPLWYRLPRPFTDSEACSCLYSRPVLLSEIFSKTGKC